MTAEQPNVTGLRRGYLRDRRCGILIAQAIRRVVGREQSREFLFIEAGQPQIEIEILQVQEFQAKQIVVPLRPSDGYVDHEPKGLHLRFGPLVAKYHGNFRQTKFSRRFET